MAKSKNPFGLHTVTPYLIVERVPELIRFMEQIFDAELRGDIKYREDGSVQHAEVKIGDSVIMMGEPMDSVEAQPGMLYVYVDDCDAAYYGALQAGATSVMPPAVYLHGDRYGGIKDPTGNVWWVVTHVGRGEPA